MAATDYSLDNLVAETTELPNGRPAFNGTGDGAGYFTNADDELLFGGDRSGRTQSSYRGNFVSKLVRSCFLAWLGRACLEYLAEAVFSEGRLRRKFRFRRLTDRQEFTEALALLEAHPSLAKSSVLGTNALLRTAACVVDRVNPSNDAKVKEGLLLVDRLMELGADPNFIPICSAASPVHIAAYAGHSRLLDLLMARGGDVTLPNRLGMDCLMLAAFQVPLEVLDMLVEHGGINVGARSKRKGWTALMPACLSDNVEAANFLLERGADPGAKLNTGELALHVASRLGSGKCMQVLVSPEYCERYEDDVRREIEGVVGGGVGLGRGLGGGGGGEGEGEEHGYKPGKRAGRRATATTAGQGGYARRPLELYVNPALK